MKGVVPENYTEKFDPEEQSKQKSFEWYDDVSEDESEPTLPSILGGDLRKESARRWTHGSGSAD